LSERDPYAKKKKYETVEGRTSNVSTPTEVARWVAAEKGVEEPGKSAPSSPKSRKKSQTEDNQENQDMPL